MDAEERERFEREMEEEVERVRHYIRYGKPLFRPKPPKGVSPVTDPDNFARNYNDALKYSQAGWEKLRQLLEREPSVRWGTHPKAVAYRQLAADAYRTRIDLAPGERDYGASLLENPYEHVVLTDGIVDRGRFTEKHVVAAAAKASKFLKESLKLPHNPMDYLSVDPVGDRHGEEHFDSPPGILADHHARVVYMDATGSDPHTANDVHFAHLGETVADHLRDHERYGDDDHMDDDGYTKFQAEFAKHLDRVRTAPVEEVNTA